MFSYGTPHMAEQKQGDQLEYTYSRYVKTRDVALRTSQRRWTIGRSGERGSEISVLVARQDDDDEWYYLTHKWEDKGVHTFPVVIFDNSTTGVRTHYDSVVHRFNHYTARTPPFLQRGFIDLYQFGSERNSTTGVRTRSLRFRSPAL